MSAPLQNSGCRSDASGMRIFISGSVWKNVFLILSVIVLGIGHIGIHLGHYRALDLGTRRGFNENNGKHS